MDTINEENGSAARTALSCCGMETADITERQGTEVVVQRKEEEEDNRVNSIAQKLI